MPDESSQDSNFHKARCSNFREAGMPNDVLKFSEPQDAASEVIFSCAGIVGIVYADLLVLI